MAIRCDKNLSIRQVQWTFPTAGVVTLHIDRVNEALRLQAMIDRLADRCTDAMALERKEYPGFVVPEEAKWEALMEMVSHLESGTSVWNKTGVTRSTGERHLFARVFTEVEGRAPDAAALKAKKPADIAVLLALPKYREVAERIRAEIAAQVTAGIDAEEMIKGL